MATLGARETGAAASFARFGVAVGHATDERGGTGLTILRGVGGALRAGVAVLGRATGSRELLTAGPSHLVDRVDAILLTGGSAYGLDAAAGVMRWMEERGRGFPVGEGVVPIVPAVVVFDLAPIGRFDARPTAEMAYAACEGASPDVIGEGSVGAGTGCTVGKGLGPGRAMKGGVGCAVAERGGAAVGALAVVNAFGDVRGAGGEIVAGARAADGHFADTARVVGEGDSEPRFGEVAMRNTTLAAVVTDAVLGRAELAQLAAAAAGALFRRITPAGTTYDGDVVFALCGSVEARDESTAGAEAAARLAAAGRGPPRDQYAPADALDRHRSAASATLPSPAARQQQLEALAVEALELAIERGVRLARGRDGIPGVAELPFATAAAGPTTRDA